MFDGAYDIGRIAAAAEGHHDIARAGEVPQLLEKNDVIADIVRVGRHRRDLLAQRHDFEAFLAAVAGAFDDVAGKMVGGGGAAPVAEDEDLAVFVAGLTEGFDGLVYLGGVDRVEGGKKLGFVFDRENS